MDNWINKIKNKQPITPKEWAKFDMLTKSKKELDYSLNVGKMCKCGICYCCELSNLIGR